MFRRQVLGGVLGVFGDLPLDRAIPYGEGDLLDHAPATRARLGEGAMTARDLAHAAVVVSDNTAANLLLAEIGGPAGLTRFMRDAGDGTTRLDRDEPSLNENAPRDRLAAGPGADPPRRVHERWGERGRPPRGGPRRDRARGGDTPVALRSR